MAVKTDTKPADGRRRRVKTSAKILGAAERKRDVLQLRMRGKTVRAIAEELNCSKSAVHEDLTRALEDLATECAEGAADLRTLELARLESATEEADAVIREADDPDLKLRAIDRLLRTSERRSKLLGLDAPTKQEVSGPGGAAIPVDLQAELGRMTPAELAARADAIAKKLRGDD